MQILRSIIILAGVLLLLAGVSCMWGAFAPWYTSFLIGATLFAYSIATLWVGLARSYHALVGGGLSFVLTFGGAALYSLKTGGGWYGQLFLYMAILSLWIYFFGLTLPRKKEEKLPFAARLLFGVIMTLALLEGIYLIVPLPFKFAWLLQPQHAILYGWMLIGGALYFAWVLYRPTWENGYPALYALLAYDLVLLGPALWLLKGGASQVVVVPSYLWAFVVTLLATAVASCWILYKHIFSRKRL